MKPSSFLRILVLAMCVPAVGAATADPLNEVDKLARDWVKMRVETVRLDTDWRSQRDLLHSTLDAMKERASSLTEKRDLAVAKSAKERKEIEALAAKDRAASADLKAGEARLKVLAQKLIALRPDLPPRLSEALEMSYRSLASPSLAFGDRMQLVMNVLNRCAQFNRTITTGEDVLTLNGEPGAKSLDVIYWGLSHGYAVDRAAHKAWLGRPGPGGWHWEAQPGAYNQVVHLLAIARDRADPAFVTVPAQVTKSVPAGTGNQTP